MRCPVCGKEAGPQDVFCTGCGTRLPKGGDEKKRPRRRAPLIAGIVVAVIAVAVIAAVVIFGPASPTTITFGSDEGIGATRSALIVPKDAAGNPLEHYLVRVLEGSDEEGAAIEMAEPLEFEVSGTGGFMLEDVLPDMPDGTYRMEIEDDEGTVLPMPPITVGDEGIDGTIEVAPDADASDDEQETRADELFLEKLEELVDDHEVPQMNAVARGYADAVAYLTGCAYAQLVDFGDGTERLVVAYLEGNEEALSYGGGASSYRLQVWEYDADSQEIVQVYDEYAGGSTWEGAMGDAIGVSFVDFTTDPETGKLCLCVYENQDGFGSHTRTYWGPGEDGTLQQVKKLGYHIDLANSSGEESWQIDGEDVSKGEYEQARAAWAVSDCYLLANNGATADEAYQAHASLYASDEVDRDVVKSVAETQQMVQATLDELRGRLGVEEQDDGEADDAALAALYLDKMGELRETYGNPATELELGDRADAA